MRDGYAEHHPLDLTVRADNLESIAGYTPQQLIEELRDAARIVAGAASRDGGYGVDNADHLRWLAALCAERVAWLEDPNGDRLVAPAEAFSPVERIRDAIAYIDVFGTSSAPAIAAARGCLTGHYYATNEEPK